MNLKTLQNDKFMQLQINALINQKIMAKKENPKGKSARGNTKFTDEVIRNKANEIYKNRIKKGIQGDAESDWNQARNELMN